MPDKHWHERESLEKEVPFDPRAYVNKIVQRLMLCRDPEGGYARYVCPDCNMEHRVPFSCKTRFCPSCGKITVDSWAYGIRKDILEVPHPHITMTTDDSFRPFFYNDLVESQYLLSYFPPYESK